MKYLITFFLMIVFNHINAQWIEKANGIYGANIQSIVSDGTSLFTGTTNGVYRSTDGGATWTPANVGLLNGHVYSLAVIGGNLFAGVDDVIGPITGGVYRSTNSGASWTLVNTGLTNLRVNGLAVIGGNLFAATWGGGVFISADAGANWSPVNNGLTNLNAVRVFSFGTNLFAGTAFPGTGGLFLSTDNGANWTNVDPAPSATAYAMAQIGTNLFAGTGSGVFLSTNNGGSWTAVNTGLTNLSIRAITTNGANLFAGTSGGGTFLSTNNGASWTPANTGMTTFGVQSLYNNGGSLISGTFGSMYVSTNNGSSWTTINTGLTNTIPYDILVAGTILYSASSGGVHISTNSGTSWTARNSGLTHTTVRVIKLSGGNLFAGTEGGGVFLSIDNGLNWTAVNSGLTDLRIQDILISGTNLFAGTLIGGVFLSTNNGTTWTPVNAGLSSLSVFKLAIIGSNLFAGTFGGCSLSTNNGASWTTVNTGLTNTIVQALTVSGTNLFAGTRGGIFLSTNNGANWTRVSNGLAPATNWIYEVTGIHGAVFAATLNGIFMTSDNGANWTSANAGLSDIEAESITEQGGTLYAGIIGRNVWIRPVTELGFSLAPTITSFTPLSGPVGTTVTITGSNFSGTLADNLVYFGATRATVTAATTTSLTVTVPTGSTHQPITVQVDGLIGASSTPFVVTTGVHTLNNCSFAPRVNFAVGPGPTSLAVADIDGDGKPDVISASRAANTVSIFLNTSVLGTIDASTLAAPYTKPTGGNSYGVGVEDLDGDGKKDIAVSNQASSSISVYRNTSIPGTISFDNRFDYAAGIFPAFMNVRDLDGDGKPELLVANLASNTVSVYKNTSVVGGFNASSFAPHVQFTVGSEPYLVNIADLNADGKPDLVASNSVSNTVTVLQNQTTTGVIDATSFSSGATLPTGDLPIGVTLEDLDSDGKPDIIVGNHESTFFSIFRNIGSGTITAASFAGRQDFTAPNGAVITAPRDLNGDAKLDLLVTSIHTDVQTIWENGSTPGTIDFTLRGTFGTDTWPGASIFVDLDGDDQPEAIVSCMVGGTFGVFKNQIGAFAPPTFSGISPAAGDIGVAVTITGTNFDPIPGNNVVLFNGVPAIPSASTATSISVVVPVGATTGPVTVTANCQPVNGAFTVCSLSAPTTTDGNHCGPGTVTLLASGAAGTQEYRWFDVPSAGTTQGTLAAYATPSITVTGTYYASIFEVATGCESARTPAVANIRAVPAAPGVSGAASCSSASVTLGATGGVNGDYRWYTVATGGTTIPGEVNDTYPTPVLTTTTTYFVALANAFCESNPRVAVTASINTVAAPAILTTTCTATSATLDGPAGFSGYLWSTGATTPQLTVTSAGAYTLIVTSSAGCSSPSSVPVTFTAAFCNQAPTATAGTATTTVMVPVTVSIVPLLTDPDNNLNMTTLVVVGSTTSGAPATINANNELVIDYSNTPFAGTDKVTVEICDQAGECVTFEVTIEVVGEITIFNAVSPNGDGKNDYFYIEYIDALPDTKENKLTLFDRWGSVVFEASGYDNTTNVFRGLGKNGEELPSGTYYFTLEFSSGATKRTGFISLRR